MLDKTPTWARDGLGETRRDKDEAERRRLDEALDEGLRETFPASDAVMIVQPVPERRSFDWRHRR
jgi:hypothetical protein